MPNFIWCLVIVSIPIGLFVILYHYLVNMDASKSDNSDKRSKQIRTRKMGVTSPPENNSLRCRKEGVVAPSLDGLIVGQNTSTDRPRKNGVTTRSIIETDYVRNRKLGVVTSGLSSEENIEVNEISTVTENKSSSRGAC